MCRIEGEERISLKGFNYLYSKDISKFIDRKPICRLITPNDEKIEMFETLFINGLGSIFNQK